MVHTANNARWYLADVVLEHSVAGDSRNAVHDPRRLRVLNETKHRVTGHLRSLLADDSRRYSDDAIVRIAVGEEDAALLKVFESAVGRCK